MNFLPSVGQLKTIAWTVAVIWALNQTEVGSDILSGKNKFF